MKPDQDPCTRNDREGDCGFALTVGGRQRQLMGTSRSSTHGQHVPRVFTAETRLTNMTWTACRGIV